MDHMNEVLVAMVIFGAISYVITQFFNHRQRMKMIETGVTKLEFSQVRNRNASSVKYGMVAIALGSAIFISQLADEAGAFRGRDLGFALVPIFVGTALIIAAIVERKFEKDNSGTADTLEMKR
ncbi:MAG: DUF6249 domain-containing protein [candidate division KSB1 bacterium]